MNLLVAPTLLLTALLCVVIEFSDAISYRCENNQVLIVQSFGNDTIRMHCQKLNLCGFANLRCNYDREQPSCGGKNNFVSHVNQVTPTGPVTHVCCELQHNSALSIPNHDGNDCFVYELPDGSSKDSTQGRARKQHSVDEDDQLTVLQNAAQIPEQIDGISGYRMKLFMLRNKSPPSLIVKAIERLPDGYRVTICRPRCGNFVSEGEIGRNEKTVKAPVVVKGGGDIMHGKVQSPAEWAAASWSAWSSSSWSSWSTSKLVGETDAEAKARGQVRGDRNKIEEAPNGGEDKRWGNGWNSGRSEGSGWPTGGITNNVNVHAVGGAGGLGGEGGDGRGGAVSGVHGGNAGAVAIANGSGAGVGVVAIDGGGDGTFGKGGAGKKGSAGGDGTAGGENGNGNGSGAGNGSEGGPDGDLGKSKANGKGPNGDGTEEGDNGNGNGNAGNGKGANKNGEGDGGDGSGNNGNGKKPNANGNVNGADSSESGASGGPNGNGKEKGNGDGSSSESGAASPDGNGKNDGAKGKGGNGGKDDKATMIMEPDGGIEAVNKVEEENRTPQGGDGSGAGSGAGDGSESGKGDDNGGGKGNGEGSNNNGGDGSSPNGSGNGLGDGDGNGNNNNGPGNVKVISGPSHLSSEKPDGDGNNGAGDGSGDNNGGDNKGGKGNGDNGNNKGDATGGDGNGDNSGNGGDADGGDGNGNAGKDGNPDGDVSGQGKSGEGNGEPNGEGNGKSSGDGSGPTGAGAGGAGPDGSGNNNGDGNANGNGNNGGDGSPDGGAEGDNAKAAGASGENAGGDGTGDGDGAGAGDKNGSNEVEGSGEGSGADVTSAEFENGPGKNPARPAGTSGEGGDGTDAGGNGNGNNGAGTNGGDNNGNSNAGGENGNNGGKITPAEEDEEGGAAGGGGVAADPGVGGGSGGGVGAAPAAGFGGLGGGLMSCFSGDMEVTTVSGTKRMDELEIGDLVLVPASGNLLKYERVEMFYHREPETTARFVQINTESGKSLTLTSLHLLPFDDCDALNEAHMNVEDVDTFMRQSKFAHKAQPGQCVISVTPSGTLTIDRIISVNRRVSKGIYSPMTVEGSIIANGVLSSCFSQLESHAVQKLAYDALVGIYNAFGYLQDALVEPTQEIPSMLSYIHQLSRFVLPFSKY